MQLEVNVGVVRDWITDVEEMLNKNLELDRDQPTNDSLPQILVRFVF